MNKPACVLVTGAAGFIGRAICANLQGRTNVVGVDVAPSPSGWNGRWLQAPFSQLGGETALLSEADAIIHAAWIGFPGAAAGFERDLERNVIPTISLYLSCCVAKISRFVFLSSGGTVYGDPASLPVQEAAPLWPVSLYGSGKATVETYLNALQRTTGVTATVLRIANPYGPGQLPWRGQGVIPTAVACAMTGTELSVWGDGTALRDYLYISDTVEAVCDVLFAERAGGTYNVASGVGRSLNEVLDCVEAVVGSPLIRHSVPNRGVDVAASILSIERIQTELGWRPKVDFRDGVEHCFAWMKQDQRRWMAG